MVIAPTKAPNLSNKNMTKNTIALKSVKAFLDQIKTKPSRKLSPNPLTKASLYRKT
ncbi:hypothetical protein BC2926_47520 [Bacillus cereus]|nr:hypothetical protein BC2926_47520 [Bacillus cereus]